jgi:hypothetical protein
LHQHIVAQGLVIVQVLVAAAQAVQTLGEQVAQTVFDARRVAWIRDHSGRCAAQPQVLIDLTQQQQTAITAEIPAAEIGFDQAPAKAPKLDLGFGTVWHRQSSVGIGGRIPMTTRLGTRLPTCYS